ncbi:MAG TPA: NAD(P)H-dependent oxidoreductase [Gemmatimonadales bacterium]|nr:NAD(P)H-dependent oxidoreductase [Gemmatimonadales bacterium]
MSTPVIGLSGSPNTNSRSRALLERTLAALERQGTGPSRLIDLAQLSSDGLLGRRKDSDVADAIQSVLDAVIIVVSTPIYRATYSGLLKVFFDLLPQDALTRKVAIAIATGGAPGHLLAVDHGLRPLLASVGALVLATGVYGTDAQFRAGVPEPALVERLERAALEAAALAAGVTI